jgi:hypothetical protein
MDEAVYQFLSMLNFMNVAEGGMNYPRKRTNSYGQNSEKR